MLQQVIVESANPILFEIGNASPDELLVCTSISGLDSADIVLFTGDFAQKGGYYQGRRVGKRNPVFYFKINPNYAEDVDASDARDILYRTFLEPQADTDGVQIRLVDDRRPDRYFIGYTEKLPADIFTARPTAQVSMVCVEPMLKSVDATTAENPSGWIAVPISYDGSADTGIWLKARVVADTAQIKIENNSQQMVLQGEFLANDIIEINTNHGQRMVRRNDEDVMATLTLDSDWLSLKQATNQMRIYGFFPGDGLAVVTEYSYRSEWWGI